MAIRNVVLSLCYVWITMAQVVPTPTSTIMQSSTSSPSVGLSVRLLSNSSSASVNSTTPYHQRLAAQVNSAIPTITIPDPAAMITYSFDAPINLASNGIVITSISEGAEPTFYLGASLVATVQAAKSSNTDPTTLLNSIAAILNPGQTLAIQARNALIALVIAAVAALIAEVMAFSPAPTPLPAPAKIVAPTSLMTTMSEVQFNASVAFQVSTTSGVLAAALTDPPSYVTGLSEADVVVSTASASASNIPSGGVVAVLSSPAPVQALVAGSGTCNTSSASRLRIRGDGGAAINWALASNTADNLLWSIQVGGPLEMLRNTQDTVLPRLIPAATNAIRSIVNNGKVIALGLVGASLFNTVALLVLAVAAIQACITWGFPEWIPIPPQAIDGSPVSASASSASTSASCPPPSAWPNCNNCGTQTTYTVSSTINLCGGLSVMAGKPATPSLLYEKCTCYGFPEDGSEDGYPFSTNDGVGLISSMAPSPAPTPITTTATSNAGVGLISSMTPSPAPTTITTTATSFGVFVAQQVATFVPPPVQNFQPPDMTMYSYNVWAGVATATSLPPPNYCTDSYLKYSIHNPKTTGKLYPTTSLANIVWNPDAKTKTCEWLPDQTGGPGSLSCNSDPTSVGCSPLQVAPTWCASEIAYEYPVIQCQWTEGTSAAAPDPPPTTSTTTSSAGPSLTGNYYDVYIAKRTAYNPAGNVKQWAYADVVYPTVVPTSNPSPPNWCSTQFSNGFAWNPVTPAWPPYPTGQLALTWNNAPVSCTYMPNHASAGAPFTQLGYLSCNQAPTSVACQSYSAPRATCGNILNRVTINPDALCTWRAQAT